MATNCSAPISVSTSQAYQKPGGSIVLYWSGAKEGIDNDIIGYLIRARDNQGSWYDYCTVYCDLPSYSTTVAVSSSRGSVRHFSVITLGSAGLNSPQSSSIGSVTVNFLPQEPSVTASRMEVPHSGDNSVSFSLTAGGDVDPGQTLTFYYTAGDPSAAKIAISGSTLNTTVSSDTIFYFWNYDGYEYNSSPAQVTILVNRLPVVSAVVATMALARTGPYPSTMAKLISNISFSAVSDFGHVLSYSYKIMYSSTISGNNLVSPSEMALDYPSVKNISIQGYYYKIRVIATDTKWPSDSGFGDSALFYAPKAPSSSNVAPQIRARNPITNSTMSTNYYRKLVELSYSGGNSLSYVNGFAKIVSASVTATTLSQNSLTVTGGTIGSFSQIYDMGENGPSTMVARINLVDEFGQTNLISSNTISRIVSSVNRPLTLSIPNSYTKIYAYDRRNTNPNKTMGLVFPDYSQIGGDTAFAGWDAYDIGNFKEFNLIINNTRYNLKDYRNGDPLPPMEGAANVTMTYPQDTIGTAETKGIFNNDSLSGSLVIIIYDCYGVEVSLSASLASRISFACPPVRNTTSSAALSKTISGTQPPLPGGTYMVYPNQPLKFTYESKIFSDENIANGAPEFNKTILFVYDGSGSTLLSTITNLGVDCEIGTFFHHQFGTVSSPTERVLKICAEDSTGLRSEEYQIGLFAVMPITGPTSGRLVAAGYNWSTTPIRIDSTFTCTYGGFSYGGVTGHSAITASLKLSNTDILGSQTPLNIYNAGGTLVVNPIPLNPFDMATPPEDSDVTLAISITYRDGTTIEYLFNSRKVRKSVPTTSLRKNRFGINKVMDDDDLGSSDDAIFYVNVPIGSPYKVVYLVNESDGRSIMIDIVTGEIDGAIIKGGTY